MRVTVVTVQSEDLTELVKLVVFIPTQVPSSHADEGQREQPFKMYHLIFKLFAIATRFTMTLPFFFGVHKMES